MSRRPAWCYVGRSCIGVSFCLTNVLDRAMLRLNRLAGKQYCERYVLVELPHLGKAPMVILVNRETMFDNYHTMPINIHFQVGTLIH